MTCIFLVIDFLFLYFCNAFGCPLPHILVHTIFTVSVLNLRTAFWKQALFKAVLSPKGRWDQNKNTELSISFSIMRHQFYIQFRIVLHLVMVSGISCRKHCQISQWPLCIVLFLRQCLQWTFLLLAKGFTWKFLYFLFILPILIPIRHFAFCVCYFLISPLLLPMVEVLLFVHRKAF